MRSFYLMVIISLWLQACSFAPSAAAVTKTPTVTATQTSTSTPTPTATTIPSPTIVKLPTVDPLATDTPIVSFIPTLPGMEDNGVTVVNPTITPSGFGEGIQSITISDSKLYYGICKPNSTKINVQVKEADAVEHLYLFVRLKSAKKEDYTEWGGYAFEDRRNGNWSYTLRTKYIKGYHNYTKAWIQYQVVGIDKKGNTIARSWIFGNSMTLQPCLKL